MHNPARIIALSVASCFAYTWTPYGPGEANINGWLFHQEPPVYTVLCTTPGILLDQGSGWMAYSYGSLPCAGACELDAQRILVAMGDGSWSDGVYTFHLLTHEFQVVAWGFRPRFVVHYPDLGAFYAGDEVGLKVSADGIAWGPVPGFDEHCLAIAKHRNHLVVASATSVHWSDDGGSVWHQAQPGTPSLCDLAFTQDGVLFGVAPGKWPWSGLWSSRDYGKTWEREFWGIFMSSVAVDCDGTVFAGWNNPGSGGSHDCGVAMWDPVSKELISLNTALPELLVNVLGDNPLVGCRSIMCGTAAGAYSLTGYLTAPDLRIELTGPSTARLSWQPGGDPECFDIYRSTSAYLTGTGTPWVTISDAVLQYDVTEGIGSESVNYFYVVRGRDAMQASPRSGTVGETDFASGSSPGTRFGRGR